MQRISEAAKHAPVRSSAASQHQAVPRQGPLGAQHFLALQRAAGNRAVQHLLASGGAQSANGGHLPVQRRLNWQKTDWSKANFLTASSGGGGGVLFAGETDREVVVKPGEALAAESAMASMLINKVGRARRTQGEKHLGKGKGKGGMSIVAPGIRTVDSGEAKRMKAALGSLTGKVEVGKTDKVAQFKRDRAQQLVGMLEEPGVVVQDLAVGKELKEELLAHQDHTETKEQEDGSSSLFLRDTSPLNIFFDKRSLTALGRITAVDLFTGNKDRLVQLYNPENLMVTPTSLTAIDNIWMGTTSSYFKTTVSKGDDSVADQTITKDDALANWKADAQVVRFADGDFKAISEKTFQTVAAQATLLSGMKKAERGAKANFDAIMEANKDNFVFHFSAGLKAGKKELIASLDRLLRDKTKLKKLAPGVDLTEIMESVRARKRFLQGKDQPT